MAEQNKSEIKVPNNNEKEKIDDQSTDKHLVRKKFLMAFIPLAISYMYLFACTIGESDGDFSGHAFWFIILTIGLYIIAKISTWKLTPLLWSLPISAAVIINSYDYFKNSPHIGSPPFLGYWFLLVVAYIFYSIAFIGYVLIKWVFKKCRQYNERHESGGND